MRTNWSNASRRSRYVSSLVGSLLSVLLISAVPASAAGAPHQWYLDDMQANDMWKVAKGEGMTVGVVDNGVESSIPELRGKVLPGWNASKETADSRAGKDGHGTLMAAIISGSGAGGGMRGLAPASRVLPVRAAPETEGEDSDIVMSRAIRYAADHGARIINVSMGSESLPGSSSKTEAAVASAVQRGKLVFAGTGNSGSGLITSPAALPGAVAVGAIDRSGKVAKFSNYGDQVGLVALGVGLPGRCIGQSGFCEGSGTSQATAIASASAALIWSAHPDWTNNQVLRVMMQTAGKPKDKRVSKYLGYGSVRPRKVLVDGEGKPGRPDVNPMFPALSHASDAPSPSASESLTPAPNETGGVAPAPADSGGSDTAAAGSSGDGGDAMPWVAVGGGVAALTLAVGAVLLVRRRRGDGGLSTPGDVEHPAAGPQVPPPPSYGPWDGS